MRVSFHGWCDPEQDDFEGKTYFTRSLSETDNPAFFQKKDKQICGFLYLRSLRTGSRALSLQRGSLLDIILRLKEVRPRMWEDTDDAPKLKAPVSTELKCGMRVDSMVAQGIIRVPDLIKIDTDGIETPILSGMRDLLAGKRPRSVLAEVQSAQLDEQVNLMHSFGYRATERHVIGRCKRGMDDIACNVIYKPT